MNPEGKYPSVSLAMLAARRHYAVPRLLHEVSLRHALARRWTSMGGGLGPFFRDIQVPVT